MTKIDANLLQKNQTYTATLVDYTAEGLAIAKIEGQIVFVPHGAVGDVCEILIVKVQKNIAYGKIVKILIPSPHRISPACPHAHQCGGCCFQHLSYAEELRAKQKKVVDALTRIGGVSNLACEIVPSPTITGYRNKAQYPVGTDKKGNVVSGFYRVRSHDIIPLERCLIQSQEADTVALVVRQWMAVYHIPAYEEQTGKGTVRHIYVRRATSTGAVQVCLIGTSKKAPFAAELVQMLQDAVPTICSVLWNVNDKRTNVILGTKSTVLWGNEMLEDVLCGYRFQLSPHAFYQVNHDSAENLYHCVVEFAKTCQCDTIIELYCGAGTITLPLSQIAKQVIAAEIVPEAVQNAKENARRNGVSNVRFLCGDAGQMAQTLQKEGIAPSLVVVDPPRKGLDEVARRAVLDLLPQHILYVSCDPATLARDVKEFCAGGYQLTQCRAFDMFPRTAHVETVALLCRKDINNHIEVKLELDEDDVTKAESKGTYENIKEYVLDKYGFKVSTLYIAQIKRKCGLELGGNYNKSKKENSKVPECPKEKEDAIMDALKHFKMIVQEEWYTKSIQTCLTV